MIRLVLSAASLLMLAGCMSWLPSFDFDGGGYAAELRLDSEPPGAEARTSGGQVCRTPCTLSVAARGDFSVTFSLAGFVPQSVPVTIRPPGDPRMDPNASSNAQFVPNPVTVLLEAAPPPPPVKRKPVRRRPPPKPAVAAPAPAPSPYPPPMLPSTIPPAQPAPPPR